MRTHTHWGICFQVWNGPQTWFWFVVNPHRDGGAIGAAASEADAMREARLSIEEISAARASASCNRADDTNACVPPLICWKGALNSLERYLACFNHAAA
jgi:hypothetical protein